MPSAVLLATATTSFLFPVHVVPLPINGLPASTASSFQDVHRQGADGRLRAPRPFMQRARSPLAFDGGFERNLRDEELMTLLQARGFVLPSDVSRKDMLELLESPQKDTVELVGLPLLPAEAARVDAFERVAPAVAYIETSVMSNAPFQLRPTELRAGAGSGFVWDNEGHVVTNYHVVAGGPVGMRRSKEQHLPRKVTVKLPGRDEVLDAKVVGVEPDKDLAVLKIDPAMLELVTPIERASSASLKVGQSVLAIGNPFGLDWTLTQGIVSAVGREIDGAGGRPIRDVIQTDAAINPGNSGGPLLDSRGRLIGVNTMIYSPAGVGANVGIGFAVPVDTVRRVVTQIIELGPNARPSLGIGVLPDHLRVQYARNLNRKLEGALVAEVVPGSPAALVKLAACERRGAGVLLGDMITAVNGTDVSDNEDLLVLIEETEPDQSLTLTVMRGADPERVEEVVLTPVPRKDLAGLP